MDMPFLQYTQASFSKREIQCIDASEIIKQICQKGANMNKENNAS